MPRVNLIPEDVRQVQTQRAHIRRWVALGVVAGGAVAIAWGVDGLRHVKATELRTQHERLQNELQTVRSEVRSATSEANLILLQIERAKALRAKRAWSGIFGLIDKCMPAECWLISVATDPTSPRGRTARRVVRTGTTSDPDRHQAISIEAPRKLRINGYAPTTGHPHAFVTALKQTGAFARVSSEGSRREEVLGGSYFRFELVCEW